jgi:negative regulator of sigma E activity
LLGKEKIDGRDCWKIESIPVDKQDMYTRKIIWVDQEGHFSLKTEYYDKDGLLKIYRALVFKRQDGFWTTFKSEMDNVSREHRTIMETSSMQYDTGIKNRMFKVSTIQRGRIR